MQTDTFMITRSMDAQDLPLPAYMSKLAAGMDLYAHIQSPYTLEPMKRALINTGCKIALPAGYEAQIRPRSGLALKHGITIPNSPGTIDADYRGEIKILLMNLGELPFVIERGDRIAQLVIASIKQIQWQEVPKLPETTRADGGFGHSGI